MLNNENPTPCDDAIRLRFVPFALKDLAKNGSTAQRPALSHPGMVSSRSS